jgi:hypothetical protein
MSTKRETTTAAEKKTTVKKAPTERKTAAAPSKAKAAPEAAGAAVPAVEAAKPKAPRARKPAAEKPATALTQVKAYIDVGPGNTLFVRGEGPGLSWEAGVPMQWTGDGCWAWSVETAGQEITFKVLINDQHWAWGDNLKVAAGDTASFTPAF